MAKKAAVITLLIIGVVLVLLGLILGYVPVIFGSPLMEHEGILIIPGVCLVVAALVVAGISYFKKESMEDIDTAKESVKKTKKDFDKRIAGARAGGLISISGGALILVACILVMS
jgi:amino acid transporter